jgi:hypothetical protein
MHIARRNKIIIMHIANPNAQSLLNEIFNGAERMRLCFVQLLRYEINSRAFQKQAI